MYKNWLCVDGATLRNVCLMCHWCSPTVLHILVVPWFFIYVFLRGLWNSPHTNKVHQSVHWLGHMRSWCAIYASQWCTNDMSFMCLYEMMRSLYAIVCFCVPLFVSREVSLWPAECHCVSLQRTKNSIIDTRPSHRTRIIAAERLIWLRKQLQQYCPRRTAYNYGWALLFITRLP